MERNWKGTELSGNSLGWALSPAVALLRARGLGNECTHYSHRVSVYYGERERRFPGKKAWSSHCHSSLREARPKARKEGLGDTLEGQRYIWGQREPSHFLDRGSSWTLKSEHCDTSSGDWVGGEQFLATSSEARTCQGGTPGRIWNRSSAFKIFCMGCTSLLLSSVFKMIKILKILE